MENTFIRLLDCRGGVVWASFEARENVLLEAHPDDQPRFESHFASCLMHNHEHRTAVRLSDGWFLVHLYPAKVHEIVVVCISHALPPCFQEFSAADREIMQQLAQDRGVQEIAAALDKSGSTIDQRIRAMKGKLGQRTLHGLVAQALHGRLITLQTDTGAEIAGCGSYPDSVKSS